MLEFGQSYDWLRLGLASGGSPTVLRSLGAVTAGNYEVDLLLAA